MKSKGLFITVCISLVLTFPAAHGVFAASGAVIMTPASDSAYVIQGNDLSGLSGLDITVNYDPSSVSSPKITQGSLVAGALSAVNVSKPGTMRLAIVRTSEIKGTGTVATVSFTRLKSTGADIRSLSASGLSEQGRAVPVASSFVNSTKTGNGAANSDTGGQTGAEAQGNSADQTAGTGGSANALTRQEENSTAGAAQNASSSGTTGAGVLLVPITIPTEGRTTQPAGEKAAPEGVLPETEQAPAQERVTVAKAEKPDTRIREPEKKKVPAYQSILEKFREYKGEKTLKSLIALFNTDRIPQDPPLVLSDGKTTVKMTIELDSKGENNNFLLEGVTLVSLTSNEKNQWVAELLPDKRTWESAVNLPKGHQLSVMPLTVAPPMDVNIDRSSAKLTEADFKLFLKERGTAKAPRFDLNGDGKRDYIDEYIFTANYISQQHRKVPQKGMR